MKRIFLLLLACVGIFLLAMPATALGKSSPKHFPVNFRGSLSGKTIYFSIAGMEPDFDLVDRVIISTRIHTKGLPPITLILDAFLENFQSETQPILPDLIHPKVQLSTTLGGFFSGEAIIVAPGNRILYTGSMLAEALIDPVCLSLPASTKHPPAACLSETQHMYVFLQGQGPAKGSSIDTRAYFVGDHKLQITSGQIYGLAHLNKRVKKIFRQGTGTLTQKQVLADFNIKFPHQMGTGGRRGQTGPTGTNCYAQHCINPSQPAPGQGHHGSNPPTTAANVSSGGVRWTMVLGFALIGLAVVLLGVYFWQSRRERQRDLLRAK